MSLLQRVHVTPFNGQVELSDPKATDYPQWQTGNEPAVALPQSIAVATQSDSHGDVAVLVLAQQGGGGRGGTRAVFGGGVFFCGDHAVVGKTPGPAIPFISLFPRLIGKAHLCT